MAQVILIEDNKSLQDLLSLNLKTYTGAEIIPMPNGDRAIDLLRILPSVDVVVSTDFVGKESTASLLLEFIRESQETPVLVVFGQSPPYKEGELVNIPDKKKWEHIVRAVGRILGINTSALDQESRPEYVSVPLSYFYSLESTPSDVYIRIKKGASDIQFVKRIHSGDSFGREMIERYEENGLKSFYIPKDMEKYFTNFVSNHLVSKLEEKSVPPEEKMALIGESYNIAVREISRLGLTTATIQLTEAIISTMMETVEKIPRMNNFLFKVINSSTGYLYRHAHMCCAIASSCVKNHELGKDEAVFQRIAFASFFQNISLTETEELAKISTEEALEQAHLGKKEYQKVYHHAVESCKFFNGYKEAPVGTRDLIKHHHGSNEGAGFPRDIDRLPELSRLFVISSHFAHLFLSYQEEKKPREAQPLIKSIHDRYKGPATINSIRLLDTIFEKRA